MVLMVVDMSDYDEMIEKVIKLLRENPDEFRKMNEDFDRMLNDEIEDMQDIREDWK